MEALAIYISVVICTFRRWNYLDQVLLTLTQQTWGDRARWEVIVVENDNTPSAEIAVIIQRYKCKFSLKHIFINTPNLSLARNAGLNLAQGEYIAYLDDDVEVAAQWLSSVMCGCKKYNPDFCGGPSFALFKTKKPFWFKDEYAEYCNYGDNSRPLKAREYIGGMNFIGRRELINSLGGFNKDFGMSEHKLWWGEEIELLKRARKVNPDLKVYYLADAIVYHLVRPEKMTLKWQIKAAYTLELSSVLMGNLSINKFSALKALIACVLNFIKNLTGLLLVFLLDIFRPERILWKRYVRDKILAYFVKAIVLFQFIFSLRRPSNYE